MHFAPALPTRAFKLMAAVWWQSQPHHQPDPTRVVMAVRAVVQIARDMGDFVGDGAVESLGPLVSHHVETQFDVALKGNRQPSGGAQARAQFKRRRGAERRTQLAFARAPPILDATFGVSLPIGSEDGNRSFHRFI